MNTTRKGRYSNWLNVLLDLAIIFTGAWLLSANDIPAGTPYKIQMGEPIIVGFLQGMVSPFMAILSLVTHGRTACALYITDNYYWAGYALGVVAVILGFMMQLSRIYNYRKHQGTTNV